MNRKRITTTALACSALAVAFGSAAEPVCRASSAAAAPVVVELYTSEGCSSCPPAERWLSGLKNRPGLIALALHVDYWDRLGWIDRFASADATARQYQIARAAGSNSVYTPQVVVNGRDWPDWSRSPLPGVAISPVTLTLERKGERVSARIDASAAAPLRLDGYWAVVEDGYQTQVGAGENAGATLHHDAVVRLYRPVSPWDAQAGANLSLDVSQGVAQHPRRVVFVVTDATTHRPLQAASLGC
ncbi:MAG: DUF1223 domain-containing protein [Burkholderiales bacterium]|nr:DUF1223 domain-containing protein [Burkholderiales bacterium]MDE2454929.1 DUF1223 domain-containing protein [Burkholderiales bacterium]